MAFKLLQIACLTNFCVVFFGTESACIVLASVDTSVFFVLVTEIYIVSYNSCMLLPYSLHSYFYGAFRLHGLSHCQ